MIFVSLIASLFLLSVATHAARSPDQKASGFYVWGLLFTIGVSPLGCFLPAVWLQVLGLVAVVLALRRFPSGGQRLALPLALAVTALAYCFPIWMVIQEDLEYKRLRELYPYESVEERVPEPKPAPDPVRLSPVSERLLTRLEERVDDGSMRSYLLRMLHEDTVRLFVSSPGFGVGRIIRPSADSLVSRLRQSGPIPQPEPHASPPESVGGLELVHRADGGAASFPCTSTV